MPMSHSLFTNSTVVSPSHLGRNRSSWHTGLFIEACASSRMSYKYKAVISYDGSNYRGYQMQAGKHAAPTVQGELEQCLLKILQTDRERLKLQGAGRTDTGVHARGQVVSFQCNKAAAHEQCHVSLNAMLPDDIRVLSVQSVPLEFAARHSAIGKEYHFNIDNHPIHDPMYRHYKQHVHVQLNVGAMRQAAQLFLGRHDFTHFANVFPSEVDPHKTLTRFDLLELGCGQLRFEVEGSGFLYRQVRHMVGALIAVGKGSILPGRIPQLLAFGARDPPGEKHRGWAVAEAKGLSLERVEYPPQQLHL